VYNFSICQVLICLLTNQDTMNTWFIHINQAVKKYNKTRQTFYNYINKWYVNTKKVNNKVFLKIQDIEKILNDYIDSEQVNVQTHTWWNTLPETTIHVEQENQTWWTSSAWNSYTQQLQEHLWRMFQQLEEWILRSTKGQMYTNQQVISSLIQNKQSDVMSKVWEIAHSVQKNSLRQRKTLFWMYYLVFVSINVFILRYIS